MVSFVVVARNAEKYLPNILKDILNQNYSKKQLELILIDGRSEDKTLQLMMDFKNSHNDFVIKVFDNPKKNLASGWNIALANSIGDIIIRVDAHTSISSDFINENIKALDGGEDIVGGQLFVAVFDRSDASVLALADTSRFGGGVANFRNLGQDNYIDSIAHAAYRRKVFEKVGGYDERLGRTEDNEMHYRIKKAGFKIYFSSKIRSCHIPRSNLRELLKQKYFNGFWIGLTMGIQPRCFRIRHFVPLFFVAALLSFIILGIINGFWCFLFMLIGIYLIPAIFFSLKSMKTAHPQVKILCLRLPAIFFLMHLMYGLGTLIGLVNMPYFIWVNRNYCIPFPVKEKK